MKLLVDVRRVNAELSKLNFYLCVCVSACMEIPQVYLTGCFKCNLACPLLIGVTI